MLLNTCNNVSNKSAENCNPDQGKFCFVNYLNIFMFLIVFNVVTNKLKGTLPHCNIQPCRVVYSEKVFENKYELGDPERCHNQFYCIRFGNIM